MADDDRYRLGDPDAAANLLRDLYVGLRRQLALWARVTHQTPQARMGYVGQHLVSVVTGHSGGRSGARGYDLVLPDGYSEIKTCYRVDQLGKCNSCGAGVASVESMCPSCRSNDVKRNDDSKWLLTPRSEAELAGYLGAKSFYLVLFDFVGEGVAGFEEEDVNARIFEVDPLSPGFALCLVDYFFNIRSKSKSKAPFNLWPFSPKFYLMEPSLIYHAVIRLDDTIETLCFDGQVGTCGPIAFPDLTLFSRATTFTVDSVVKAARLLGEPVAASTRPAGVLAELQLRREQARIDDSALAQALAWGVYEDLTAPYAAHLPPSTRALRDRFPA